MSLSLIFSASLNKIVELSKQLLVAVYKLLNALLKGRIGKLADSLIALSHQKLGVTECIFNIKQFFRCHKNFLQIFLSLKPDNIICTQT